jgi:hypothetical protein
MLTNCIIVLAMMGQAPAPSSIPTKGPLSAAQLKALSDEINRKYDNPRYRAMIQRDKEAYRARLDELMRRREAERPAREAAARQERARIAKVQAEAQQKAQDNYKAMLPYMMEQQRQELERMSAIERNQALHRMAAAAESEADTYARRTQAFQWYLMQQRAR